MSPRGPSAPTSIPSYSCWARSIVFLALKWSVRAPSCWSVGVMTGGAGFRLRSPRVTALTVHRLPSSPATTSCTRASPGRSAFSPRISLGGGPKSGGFFPRSFAWRLQYSTGTNARISRSRSARSRTATDWTRPAERPRWTFRQRRGERLYPTRRSRTRRACWASTFFWSILPGCANAALIARAVISLNVTRYTFRPLTGSSWARCQPIASPSRSGSVATYSASAFSEAFFSSSSTFRFAARTRYSGLKPFFTSTPSRDLGRSRTCPMQALTMYFESRYFWIVLTFVGDSTTTSDRFATNVPLLSREADSRIVLAGQLSHPALQLQAQERRRRPPGRDAAPLDHVIDVDRFAAEQRQDSCLVALGRGFRGSFRVCALRQAAPPHWGELGKDVLPALNQFSTVLDEAVGAPARFRRDRPRHGEHFPAELARVPRRDQGAGMLRRFHHDRPQREPGDRSVAQREVPGQCRRPHGELGDQRPALEHLGDEFPVLLWIGHVHAAAEDGDGASACRQSATVCRAVDATREAAHDGHAARGQVGSQALGRLQPVRGGAPRADDRQRERVLLPELSPRQQERRRSRHRLEGGRILLVLRQEQAGPP